MKNKLIHILIIIAFCLLFPTALTLFISGKKQSNIPKTYNSGKTIIIEQDSDTINMDIEEFIPCVLANQLNINSHSEALKAQAIIVRTYILYYMGENNKINAESLNLSYTIYDDLKNTVGDDYSEYYTKLKTAVSETSGLVIKYNNKLIIPYFHGISAGMTRTGSEALGSDAFPYLISKDSSSDTEATDYLTITYLSKKDFVDTLKKHRKNIQISEENPLETMQVLGRCSAGYISSIQIGDNTFTGDEIQMYFSLKSPYFEFEDFEDQIRIICKGNGHGLGYSIYGGCKMAENGSTCSEILTYFYTDITIEK